MVAWIKTHRNPSPTTSKIFSQYFSQEREKKSTQMFHLHDVLHCEYGDTDSLSFFHCLPCLSKHICNWGSFSFCFLQSLKNCDVVTYQNVHVNWWFFFHLLQSLNEFSCYNLKWSGYVWDFHWIEGMCLIGLLVYRQVSEKSFCWRSSAIANSGNIQSVFR